MKKLLLLLFILFNFSTFAQFSPKPDGVVNDSITPIGVNLPKGSKILNLQDSKLWHLTDATSAATTLQNASKRYVFSVGFRLGLNGIILNNTDYWRNQDTLNVSDGLVKATSKKISSIPDNSTMWNNSADMWDVTNWYGFVLNTETTLSFNPVDSTLTLAKTGASWRYVGDGIVYTISSNKTCQIPVGGTGIGTYYFYINDVSGTISVSASPWTLKDSKMPVAIIKWNKNAPGGFKYFMEDERHGGSGNGLWPRSLHYYVHATIGTRYQNGCLVTNTTIQPSSPISSDNQFTVTAGEIDDEDLDVDIAVKGKPLTNTHPWIKYYRTAASTWRWDTTAVPYLYSATYIQYDNNGVMTTAANNQYVNSYIYLTNARDSARIVIVPGRAAFASVALAHAEDPKTFDMSGFDIAEAVCMYRVTWQTNASYTNALGRVRLNNAPQLVNQGISSTGVPAAANQWVYVSAADIANANSGNVGIGVTDVPYHKLAVVTSKATNQGALNLVNSDWNKVRTSELQASDTSSLMVDFTDGGKPVISLKANNGTNLLSSDSTGSLVAAGSVTAGVITNETTDVDKFLVSNAGTIKYRTGTELLSDIGVAMSEVGTAAGQMLYWDTDKWKHSTHLTWDEGTDMLTSPTVYANTRVYTQLVSSAYIGSGVALNLTAGGSAGILFNEGSTEVARFAPTTGNLLLGTTSDAGTKLNVNGSILAYGNIWTGQQANSGIFMDGKDGYNAGFGTDANFSPSIYVDGVQKLVVTHATGNVLIKTTTDNTVDALQVAGTILANGLVLPVPASSSYGIVTSAGANGSGMYLNRIGTTNDYSVSFFVTDAGVNNYYPLTLDYNGKVLVGGATNNNVDALQVNGSGHFSTLLRVGAGTYAVPPTYGGAITLLNGFYSNGPDDVTGIDFVSNYGGYGAKLYADNTHDIFGIATRYGSAAWTERFTLSLQTGNATLAGTLTVNGGNTKIYAASGTRDILELYSGAVKTHVLYSDNDNGRFALGNSSSVAKVVLRSDDDSYITGGKFGIGTISPSELLDIRGASGLDGATPVTLKLYSTNNGTWTAGAEPARIDFADADDGGYVGPGTKARISSYVSTTAGGRNGLKFYTTGDETGFQGLTNTLTITPSGTLTANVTNTQDIGTSSNLWRAVYATNLYGAITPTGFTAGSVVFAGTGGVLSQDNAGIYYDATNHRLSIGRAGAAAAKLHITDLNGVDSEIIRFGRGDDNRFNSIYTLVPQSSTVGSIGFRVHNAVTGDSQSTVLTLEGTGKLYAPYYTSTYIPYFGASGEIKNSANFIYDETNKLFTVKGLYDTRTDQIVVGADGGSARIHIGSFTGEAYIFNNYFYNAGHNADNAAVGSFGILMTATDFKIQSAAASATPSRVTRFQITDTGTLYASKYTTGSIPFFAASGEIAQDNANLFWDNTNKRLGVGIIPVYALDIKGNAILNTMALRASGTANGEGILFLDGGTTPTKYNFFVGAQRNVDNTFEITPSTAVAGTTFTTPAFKIAYNGQVSLTFGASAGYILQSDASGNASWVAPSTIADLNWVRDAVNGYVYTRTATDKVGIGTSTPVDLFTVHVGTDQNIGMLSSGGLATIRSLNDANNAYTQMNFIASNYSMIGGYLGIASSAITPYYRLDVAGDIRIQGANKLYFGGTGIGDGDNSLYRISSNEMEFSDGLKVTGTLTSVDAFYGVSSVNFASNIAILNKAASAYINFASRNATGAEAVYDLTNVGTIATTGKITINNAGWPILELYDNAAGIDLKRKLIVSHSGNLLLGKTNDAWSTETYQLVLMNDGTVAPGANGTQDFGSTSYRWNNIYSEAGNFSGTVGIGISNNVSTGLYLSGDITTSTYQSGVAADMTLSGTLQCNQLYAGGFVKANTTVAEWAGLRIDRPGLLSGAATTTAYGIYIGSYYETNRYAIYVEGGKSYFAGVIQSAVATGTAPLTVASTTLVSNLNADLLDGQHGSYYQVALTNPVTGTGTAGYIPKFTGASSIGNSIINTTGTDVTTFSTYKGANSDGYNLFIGGGGQNSIGEIGATYKGSYNTANGVQSLQSNTIGSYNTANGVQSLYSNTTGYQNTANGVYSLYSNTTGYYNTANGMQSLQSNTTGSYNTANGFASLFYNTTGTHNLSEGYYSGMGAETAAEKSVEDTYMTFLGAYASKQNALTITNGTALGYNAKVLQSNQVVLGNSSVTSVKTYGVITAPTIACSNLTDGYLPYHISDASGLGNSNIITDGTYNTIGGAIQTDFKLKVFGGALTSCFQSSAAGESARFTDGTYSTLNIYHVASGNQIAFKTGGDGQTFSFYTYSSSAYHEQMRITDAGVGIGTTSITSGYLLDVNGNIYGRGTLALGTEAYVLPSTGGTAGQMLVMPASGANMVWATPWITTNLEAGTAADQMMFWNHSVSKWQHSTRTTLHEESNATHNYAQLEFATNSGLYYNESITAYNPIIEMRVNEVVIFKGTKTGTDDIATYLSALTANGFVKTSGSNGLLTVDNTVVTTSTIEPKFGTAVDSTLVNTTIKFPIGYSQGLVIDTIIFISTGAAVNVTPKISYGTDISATGTAVVTSPSAITSVTTSTKVSTFNNATIAKGNMIWLTFTGVTTKPRNFMVQIIGHQ